MYTHTHTHTHVHTHTHTHTCTHTHMHACTHTRTHAYTHTHAHTHTHIPTHAHTHMPMSAIYSDNSFGSNEALSCLKNYISIVFKILFRRTLQTEQLHQVQTALTIILLLFAPT